jgi:AraC-like DNA-binding protein
VERVLTKAEQKFIADAKAMVEKNMSDSGYTTERFASDMCMSRMNLYRKIQKITGQKPSEFVRMIRLHTAAKMLREGDASVSAVAEAVGFSSPSYFTKCFKETFGMQPLQYHYYRNDKSN